MISIVIIGAGNVASHLFKTLKKSEKVIVKQWFNRHLEAIQFYKNEVEITDDISSLKEADVYIIAVSDDAISGLSSELPFTNRLVVHTSGSVGVHELDKKHRRGVFYPFQTFRKEAQVNFKNVPICIEVIEKMDFIVLKSL